MNDYEQNIEVMKDLKAKLDKVLTSHESTINIQPKDTSKGHFYVSLAKSVIRIAAGACLVSGNFVFAGVGFILAEVLGIVEELV